MEFVPLVALPILVAKIIDFLSFCAARDINAALKQLLSWLGCIAGLYVVIHSGLASNIPITGTTLGSLNLFGIIFVGMTAGSLGSFAVADLRKTLDSSQSAAVPALLPAPPPGRHRGEP